MLHLKHLSKGTLADYFQHYEVLQCRLSSPLLPEISSCVPWIHCCPAPHCGLNLFLLLVLRSVVVILLRINVLALYLGTLLLPIITHPLTQPLLNHLVLPSLLIIFWNQVLRIVPEILGRILLDGLLFVFFCGGVASQVLLLDVVNGQVLFRVHTVQTFQDLDDLVSPNIM